jgi:hypothetical protein
MIGLKRERCECDYDVDENMCVYNICIGYKSDSDDDELVDIESNIRERNYRRISDSSAYCTLFLYTISMCIIGSLYWHSVILYR